jgi:hypothetical protein
MRELEHQRRFPATGFSDCQHMTPQQARRQDHLHAVPLVVRRTDPAALAGGVKSDGGRKWEATPRRRAFNEWNVISRLR